MSWQIVVPHGAFWSIDWTGLRPRLTIEHRGRRVTYKPKVSGRAVFLPMTGEGLPVSFERSA